MYSEEPFARKEAFYLVTPIITSKLPLDLLVLWNKTAKAGQEFEVKELLAFLKAR